MAPVCVGFIVKRFETADPGVSGGKEKANV